MLQKHACYLMHTRKRQFAAMFWRAGMHGHRAAVIKSNKEAELYVAGQQFKEQLANQMLRYAKFVSSTLPKREEGDGYVSAGEEDPTTTGHEQVPRTVQQMSALQFWTTYTTRFPLLSVLARMVLCISLSSCDSERVFSKVRLCVRHRATLAGVDISLVVTRVRLAVSPATATGWTLIAPVH